MQRVAAAGARKTVAVVGLGTAGAAAATFLARQGHAVKVFEKYPIDLFDTNRGAGIGLQPIGLSVLARLGILDPILSYGARVDRLHSVTPSGRAVLDLEYADFHKDLYGLGLSRNVLFTELYNLAANTAGVDIHCGVDVETVTSKVVCASTTSRQNGGAAALEKSFVQFRDGTAEGPFDLTIVADGRSSIRRNMPVKSFEKPYPFGCLWASLPDAPGAFSSSKTLHQKLDTAEVMLGVLPTGRVHGMSPSDPQLITLFWSIELAKIEAVKSMGIDAWKARVLGYMPQLETHLELINSFDDLIAASYSDTFMPKYYQGDNIVFLGDAAHATSPQLGQGANLALVDAWTLGNSLEAFPGQGQQEFALKHFDAQRRWRLRFYQLNSHLLTPLFQSNSRLLGLARDLCMGPACRFWLTKMQMLTVLTGAQNNGIPWTTIPEDEYLYHVKSQPET